MTEPLPVGSILLHIGPHKTGTTTLQGALHQGRGELRAHGVHYAGKEQQARFAAAAAVGSPLHGRTTPYDHLWPELVREVRAAGADRVVISSETFANADDAAIARIAHDLGPHTQVVITLRPLVKLLSSQWQQYVQTGQTQSYGDWLEDVFREPPTVRGLFWRRHSHDRLANRWAAVLGAERVTVVALREGDLTMNLRVFEQLLALPAGLLLASKNTNRSFSLPEIELVREINRQFWEQGWPRRVHDGLIRWGLDYYLKERTPSSGEQQIVTPLWALQRADERARSIVEGLRASGVRVIGDLAWLRVPVPEDAPHATANTDLVALDIAARAVLGALEVTVINPRRVVADVLVRQPNHRAGRVASSIRRALAARWHRVRHVSR